MKAFKFFRGVAIFIYAITMLMCGMIVTFVFMGQVPPVSPLLSLFTGLLFASSFAVFVTFIVGMDVKWWVAREQYNQAAEECRKETKALKEARLKYNSFFEEQARKVMEPK